MHVNRRRFLQAGAAGAAGAALLPAAGCSMDETGSREHMNVLLLIVDSLRPDHVGRLRLAPGEDAEHRRAGRPRPALQPRLPGGDGHDPGAALDLHHQADLPVPPLGAEPRARHAAPAGCRSTTSSTRSPASCAATATGPRRCPTTRTSASRKAYEPFRKSFDHWKSIPGQAGTFKPASTVPARDASTSGCRRSCATSATSRACASTWPTRARACARTRPARRASTRRRSTRSTRRGCASRSAWWSTASTRTSPGARSTSTSTCTTTRATRARRSA